MFFNKYKMGPLARLVAVIVLLCNTLGSPLTTLEAAPVAPRAPETVSPVTFDIAQALNQLLEALMAYQARGSFTDGVGGSLVNKLQNAQRQLANGQTKATPEQVAALRQNAEQAFLAEAHSPLHGDEHYSEFGGCNTRTHSCRDGLHPGLDSEDYRNASGAVVKVNAVGREVYATAYGQVASVGITDAGRYVMIEHDAYGEKFYSVYLHLNTQTVKTGQWVDENTQIGTMGNTTTWPDGVAVHLHFEVRKAANVDLIEPYGNPFYGKKWYVKDWEELHQNFIDLSQLSFAGGK